MKIKKLRSLFDFYSFVWKQKNQKFKTRISLLKLK